MQGYTFSEISRKWLENAVIGVSFSWDEELKSIVGHLNKALGKKKIDDIKASDIEFLIKTLSVKNPNTNKPSSKRFLKCISNVSNSIFDFAIDNKYASGNPACKSARKIPKSAPTKIVDAVNDKQKNLIIEYEHSTKIAAIIMMFMGLRTGELLALEWKDIDFDEKVVHINKKCSELQKKIAQKEKELATAEKNMRNEEDKVNKKKNEEEKKRIKEQAAQIRAIEQTMQQQASLQAAMQFDIDKLKAIPNEITVLFMASNPEGTSQLRLDEEVRAIQEKIRLSEFRDSIHFESRWAVRSADILQAINETNPTIVHFSGHGAKNGDLVLSNPDGTPKFVSKEAISMAISTASDTVRLVVFNACFSEHQAKSVVDNIEAAIGMSDSIRDDTAVTFAAQLYSTIGFGYSLEKAFKQAIAAIMLEGISQEDIPQLFKRDDVELNQVILVNPD